MTQVIQNPENSVAAPEFVQCLLCNHSDLSELDKYFHAHLVQCRKCGFVFCKKIPTTLELINHYKTYPRNDSISPITIKRYNELLDVFDGYKNTDNLLDVGCGNGHFLAEAKKRGWKVYGTEYTDEAIAICRSKDIVMQQGKLKPADFGDLKFDIITSFEVMEHINNPVEEITNFKLLLRDNGIVYVTTPNFNSLSRYFLKDKWSIIEYPEHLCYYTIKTLKSAFHQQGFGVTESKTTGISLTRFNQGITNAGTSVMAWNADEGLRQKTESSFIFAMAKKTINALLTATRSGDTIKAIFTKR